ncbi:MAG: Gfo/Idh/MocA family oxidoreductase [Clostridiales bacterium]|nr:Gfo/Idh/MocA family oxidoreductase [Clostridiales bacterium]
MKVRVAMISKWHVHAVDYAKNIMQSPNAELFCVWDEDPLRGEAWARELNVPFEKDIDTLFARDDVDGVIIDTPTSAHHQMIMKAAKAGKHIFTEKVLVATLKEGKEIQNSIEKNQIKFCISYPQRITSQILYVKKIIEDGSLGKLSVLRIRNAHGGASDNWLPKYWYDEKEACGGAMMDLGAHPAYQAAFLLGKPIRVAAMFNSLTKRGDTEDNAVSVFEFEKDVIAILETGFVTPFSPWRLELMGTEGSLLIDEKKVRIIGKELTEGKWVEVDEKEMPDPLETPMNQWIDGILNDTPIVFDVKEALPLTQMMELAYQSHEKQQIIKADDEEA